MGGDCAFTSEASKSSPTSALYVKEFKIDGVWKTSDEYHCLEPVTEGGGLPDYWQNTPLMDVERLSQKIGFETAGLKTCESLLADHDLFAIYRRVIPNGSLTTCTGGGGWRWYSISSPTSPTAGQCLSGGVAGLEVDKRCPYLSFPDNAGIRFQYPAEVTDCLDLCTTWFQEVYNDPSSAHSCCTFVRNFCYLVNMTDYNIDYGKDEGA